MSHLPVDSTFRLVALSLGNLCASTIFQLKQDVFLSLHPTHAH